MNKKLILGLIAHAMLIGSTSMAYSGSWWERITNNGANWASQINSSNHDDVVSTMKKDIVYAVTDRNNAKGNWNLYHHAFYGGNLTSQFSESEKQNILNDGLQGLKNMGIAKSMDEARDDTSKAAINMQTPIQSPAITPAIQQVQQLTQPLAIPAGLDVQLAQVERSQDPALSQQEWPNTPLIQHVRNRLAEGSGRWIDQSMGNTYWWNALSLKYADNFKNPTDRIVKAYQGDVNTLNSPGGTQAEKDKLARITNVPVMALSVQKTATPVIQQIQQPVVFDARTAAIAASNKTFNDASNVIDTADDLFSANYYMNPTNPKSESLRKLFPNDRCMENGNMRDWYIRIGDAKLGAGKGNGEGWRDLASANNRVVNTFSHAEVVKTIKLDAMYACGENAQQEASARENYNHFCNAVDNGLLSTWLTPTDKMIIKAAAKQSHDNRWPNSPVPAK